MWKQNRNLQPRPPVEIPRPWSASWGHTTHSCRTTVIVTVLFEVMLINDVIGCWVNVYNRQNFSFCLMINYNYTYCTYKTSTKTFFINYKNVPVKCWSWNCQITSQQIEKQIYKIIKNKLNIKVIWDQLIIMLFQC